MWISNETQVRLHTEYRPKCFSGLCPLGLFRKQFRFGTGELKRPLFTDIQVQKEFDSVDVMLSTVGWD